MLNPNKVPVYIAAFLIHLDIDQVQRLVEQGRLRKCREDQRFEHYHVVGEALEDAYSERRPLDLTSVGAEQFDAVKDSVDALIAKATKG